MKPKHVHAQRKYAQGVHIPVSITTPPERRMADVSGQQTSQIYYNNNNAKNLLDVVSFSNIHKHRQPIVLIERLETKFPLLIKDQTNKVKANDISKRIGYVEKSLSTPLKNTSRKKSVARIEPIPSTSALATRCSRRLNRSIPSWGDFIRTSNTDKPKRPPIVKTYTAKVKSNNKFFQSVLNQNQNQILSNISNPSPVSNLTTDDDEMPLTYFKHNTLKEIKDGIRHKLEKRKASNPSLIKSSKPKIPSAKELKKATIVDEDKQKTIKKPESHNVELPKPCNGEAQAARGDIETKAINELKKSTTIIAQDKQKTIEPERKERRASVTFLIKSSKPKISSGNELKKATTIVDEDKQKTFKEPESHNVELAKPCNGEAQAARGDIETKAKKRKASNPSLIKSSKPKIPSVKKSKKATIVNKDKEKNSKIPDAEKFDVMIFCGDESGSITDYNNLSDESDDFQLSYDCTNESETTTDGIEVRAGPSGIQLNNESNLLDNDVQIEEDVLLISDDDVKDIKLDPPTSSGITNRKRRMEQSNTSSFDKMVDAPVFNPTVEEFADPITYFEKVMPIASKFGICKIVPPPGFMPSCYLSESIKFHVSNQYISRLYTRWGPAIRELCAIRLHLATANVKFKRPPLIHGLEVDLPRLFHTVQRLGGLKKFSGKKKWSRVSEEMNFVGLMNPSKKLEFIYLKYIMPYETLKSKERQERIVQVEEMWFKKNKRMLARANNPLHRQKRLLGESDTDDEFEGSSDADVEYALAEAEDCIAEGRPMKVQSFRNVAFNAIKTFLPTNTKPSTKVIEDLYWKTVLLGSEHVCVNSASVDTGEEGYGFSLDTNSPDGSHPWNLKVLSQNKGNVLRPLGRVLGLTVPTLHLGMVFSTSCWHRDPHGLPWIEYMHKGPDKIWYGIPDDQSDNFQKAMERLYPTACQNKGIWLPSDITMVPPNLLLGHNVSMSKLIQKPGEFVIVFPKAYSSSICTGYTVSESVYFGTKAWFNTMVDVFQELRDSCEPSTFALEQLLMAIARDTESPWDLSVLGQAHTALDVIVTKEISNRAVLRQYGIPFSMVTQPPDTLEQDNECEICRRTLYLSRVTGVFSKDSTLCLEHAISVLVSEQRRSKRNDKAKSTHNQKRLPESRYNKQRVEFFINDKDLQEIVHKIKQRIVVKLE